MATHKLTHNEFCERYGIVSTTGRCYGRTMLINTATRLSLFKVFGLDRSEVAAVIDDDTWMRGRKGEVPSSCAEAAVFEAFHRRGESE